MPGLIRDGDSYRCELAGLLAIVIWVNTLCKLHNLAQGSVLIACDNISTLRIFEPGFVPSPQQDSFDLAQALWKAIKASPINWRTQWVEGHTDDPEKKLLRLARPQTRLEKLNCEMDAVAKAVWNEEHAADGPMVAQVYSG